MFQPDRTVASMLWMVVQEELSFEAWKVAPTRYWEAMVHLELGKKRIRVSSRRRSDPTSNPIKQSPTDGEV